MTKRKKITLEERKKIEEMSRAGSTPREMAAVIGVHFTTIYNELRRCPGEYNAMQAQATL